MKLINSPFSILNKNRREIEYIKEVYKRRIQSEIESHESLDQLKNKPEIKTKDILFLEKISI